jgi:8-oxo-dGTP pyrophosphatase MutT (NUDIX family)
MRAMIAAMRRETSCGVLLFQDRPRRSLLLLIRNHRLDLPKGHIKRGEDELGCALRELEEETGIAPSQVSVVDGFRFETTYHPGPDRIKTVVLFAAEVEGPMAVETPEHDDYAWVDWRPPHDFRQFPTIHKALEAWAEHLAQPPRLKRSSARASSRPRPPQRNAS